jgi:hypothetical protein
MKLKCENCGNIIYTNHSTPFSPCKCGASLSQSEISMISDIDLRILELHTEITRKHDQGVGDLFTVLD